MKSKKNKSRGQALVETALILPMILLILFGIIQFGLILNAYIVTSNASREGARYAVTGHTDSEIKQVVIAKAASLGVQDKDITINPTTRVNGDPVTVTVSCSAPVIIPFIKSYVPGIADISTINSSTSMRME